MEQDKNRHDANRSTMGTPEDPSAQTAKRRLQEDPDVPEPMEETMDLDGAEESRHRSEEIRNDAADETPPS